MSNFPGVAVISCLKPLVLGTHVEKITVYKTCHNSLFSKFICLYSVSVITGTADIIQSNASNYRHSIWNFCRLVRCSADCIWLVKTVYKHGTELWTFLQYLALQHYLLKSRTFNQLLYRVSLLKCSRSNHSMSNVDVWTVYLLTCGIQYYFNLYRNVWFSMTLFLKKLSTRKLYTAITHSLKSKKEKSIFEVLSNSLTLDLSICWIFPWCKSIDCLIPVYPKIFQV